MNKFGKFTLSYVSVDQGFICVRKVKPIGIEEDLYDVYTFCPEFGDFKFQFGISAKSREEATDIALGNYENGNLLWQSDLECDCTDICDDCDRRYLCNRSDYIQDMVARLRDVKNVQNDILVETNI